MERNEFTKRLKRLVASILAVAVITYCGQNIGMYVLAAEGDESDTNIPLTVTYGSADGRLVSISGSYTNSVTIDKDAYSATVVLPEAKMDEEGYVFDNWTLGITGGGNYAPGGPQVVSWDPSIPASSISANYWAALPFYANSHVENIINISYVMASDYKDIGQVEDGVQTQYKESIVPGPVSITLPGVTESSDEYVFVGWKCYDASEDQNENRVEIIIDGYIENYRESGIDVYPEDAVLTFAYPTDEANRGGNVANYVFEAQFTTAKSVKVNYDTKGGEAMEVMEQTIYQKNIGAVATILTLPEAPKYEGYAFQGWIGENRETYEAGSKVTIDLGAEVTFTALWVPVVGEGSREIINIGPYQLDEGTWKLEGDDSIYPGGIFFYVPDKGVYTFTRQ